MSDLVSAGDDLFRGLFPSLLVSAVTSLDDKCLCLVPPSLGARHGMDQVMLGFLL